MRARFVAALACLSLSASVQAATYYGFTSTPNGVVSGDALNARNSFIGALTSYSTEGFESFGMNQTPLTLSFQGSAGTSAATLSGVGNTDVNRGNTFATSGSKEFIAYGTSTIDFASPVSAFGFYATDVADLGGFLTVLINGGSSGSYNLVSSGAGSNGNLLFFGITSVDPITSITFSGASSSDGIGLDDLTVGNVAAVPEPATWAMFIGGFVAVGGAMRRRRRAIVNFA